MPDYIILSREMQNEIGHYLEKLLGDTDAYFVIFAAKSGELLGKRGGDLGDKVASMTALLTGIFNASREMAGLIGEQDFEQFLIQGKEWKLFYQNITPLFLLIVIFKKNALLGSIRISTEECAVSIKGMFEKKRDRIYRRDIGEQGDDEERIMRGLFGK